jgi:hypothetical protein
LIQFLEEDERVEEGSKIPPKSTFYFPTNRRDLEYWGGKHFIIF